MIDFYITEQSIRFASPVIAANSLDYLEARFHFSSDAWDGYSKWAHFRQGTTVYDLNLTDDAITADMHLNLSLGQWEVYVTGSLGESRLTTVPVILTVMESGLIDEPLHQIPQTVAEQIDNKATLALQKAIAVETAAENGAYDGKNFQILGYYASPEALMAAVTEPERGDAYGVGAQSPYDVYIYNAADAQWVNNGSIQGPQGDTGESGATFIPQLAANGNLSWINDGGLQNPATVNIMGPQGARGQTGADGQSPYQIAVEEGFTGTRSTFNWSLANIASHGAQHGSGGTDPVTVGTDGIEDGAVTAAKLAPGVVCSSFTGLLPASGWPASAPYTQTVAISGLPANSVNGSIDADLSAVTSAEDGTAILEAWARVSRAYESEAGYLTAVCYESAPETDIPVRIVVLGGGVGGGAVEYYGGSYSVTPAAQAQTLNTENLVMTDNVEVSGIPQYTVSNDSGQTVIIG